MERTRFARGKVTGRRSHSKNLVRILWMVDIIELDFIQTHLKVCQFNLRSVLFISRGPQTAKLMYIIIIINTRGLPVLRTAK